MNEATAGGALPPAVMSAVALHRLWRAHEADGVQADLRQWSLPGAGLQGVDLARATLRDIDLSGANLRGAKLKGADLRFASLRNADLRDADLESALLDFASLEGALLTGAWLRGASLSQANLDGVRMSWLDHTLLSERLMRAAGDDLETRMLAAYIGRMTNYCWDDYRELPVRYRLWLIRVVRGWKTPGDDAPSILDDRF